MSDPRSAKDPADIRAERRGQFLKRLSRQLEQAKMEAMANRFLPGKVIDQLDEVAQWIEKEMERE